MSANYEGFGEVGEALAKELNSIKNPVCLNEIGKTAVDIFKELVYTAGESGILENNSVDIEEFDTLIRLAQLAQMIVERGQTKCPESLRM